MLPVLGGREKIVFLWRIAGLLNVYAGRSIIQVNVFIWLPGGINLYSISLLLLKTTPCARLQTMHLNKTWLRISHRRDYLAAFALVPSKPGPQYHSTYRVRHSSPCLRFRAIWEGTALFIASWTDFWYRAEDLNGDILSSEVFTQIVPEV